MKISYSSLLFMLLLFTACHNYTQETLKLKNVLSHYSESISQKNHLYIVRSRFYCEGCVQFLYFQMEQMLNSYNRRNITIVSYDRKYISAELLSKIDFIYDTLSLTNVEFPTYANLTIFETKKGKVVNVMNIGDSKKLSIPRFFKTFIKVN